MSANKLLLFTGLTIAAGSGWEAAESYHEGNNAERTVWCAEQPEFVGQLVVDEALELCMVGEAGPGTSIPKEKHEEGEEIQKLIDERQAASQFNVGDAAAFSILAAVGGVLIVIPGIRAARQLGKIRNEP